MAPEKIGYPKTKKVRFFGSHFSVRKCELQGTGTLSNLSPLEMVHYQRLPISNVLRRCYGPMVPRNQRKHDVNFWWNTRKFIHEMKLVAWKKNSPRVMSRGHGMIFPYGQRCWWHNLSTFSGFWFKTTRVFTMKLDISRVNPGIYKLEPKNPPLFEIRKIIWFTIHLQPLGSSRWVSRGTRDSPHTILT